MNSALKKSFKRMGVMNVTPNSFSDGNQLQTREAFEASLRRFGSVESIDVGAESTAPMNSAISAQVEWERFQFILPVLMKYEGVLSIDTYHHETIFEFVKLKQDKKLTADLIWNDVSGKFDEAVGDFLRADPTFKYVFCHNLAPSREKSIEHMKTVSPQTGEEFLHELKDYFSPHKNPQVIFDPCLGFSKTYEQNWLILNEFQKLQELCHHPEWLIGFSRKSFLRKKYQIENLNSSSLEKLDQIHCEEFRKLKISPETIVWIRTHRPELLLFAHE